MYADGQTAAVSPLAKIFSKFSVLDLRMLAGNSMHAPTFAAWFLYAVSNTRLIPVLEPLTPLLEA